MHGTNSCEQINFTKHEIINIQIQVNLKRNTIANFIGQGYSILIGIVITPVLIKYIGPEAYGLIGFYILMQTWFNLLDLGLSATFGRHASLERSHLKQKTNLKLLLRSIETFFAVLSTLTIITIFFSKDLIAQNWLQSNTLSKDSISTSLIFISFIISSKWFATIYRSGINGLEDQVYLNIFNNVCKYI